MWMVFILCAGQGILSSSKAYFVGQETTQVIISLGLCLSQVSGLVQMIAC